jgi:peptidyl-prolyl cis-trans isomerase A (cyclophilin A)
MEVSRPWYYHAIMSIYCRVAVLFLPALSLLAQASAQESSARREPGLYARFETTQGNFVVRLFEKQAPATVKSFVDLAEGRKPWRDPQSGEMVKKRLYDGTIFHRVIRGFMIQGGDPAGTGSSDPGFTIPDEFDPSLKFDVPGRLAMANIGDPNSGACQFFITEVPTPHLDGKHTIFGQVVEGLPVVSRIAGVPRDAEDKPLEPVKINRLVIERVQPAQTKD